MLEWNRNSLLKLLLATTTTPRTEDQTHANQVKGKEANEEKR
jgi:hypothetical protein